LPDFSWHFFAPDIRPAGNPGDPNACPKARGRHPVDYSTGIKIENATDVSWTGMRGGLIFGRVYTSQKSQAGNCPNCPFGGGWNPQLGLSFDRSIFSGWRWTPDYP